VRVGVGGCSAALMQACADEDLPESKKDTGRTGPLGLATSKVRRVKNVSASGAPSRCAERSSLEQGPAGAGVCRRRLMACRSNGVRPGCVASALFRPVTDVQGRRW
jgi:hypothetical protein